MNKRGNQRYTGNHFIQVQWKSGGNSAEGVATNLSRTGAGICCVTSIETGSEITITFHFEDEQKSKVLESVKGVVKWSRKLGSLYTAGVEWMADVNEEDIFLALSQIELAKEYQGN